MILPFSTQLNGKPTYFVEKIWEGLLRNIFEKDEEYQHYLKSHKKQFGSYWDWFPENHPRLENPKIHTIRYDKNNRWKPGTMIDFFINCRQKNMFRFAPRLPVVSTQKIEIIYTGGSFNYASIYIDDKCFVENYNQHQIIAEIKHHSAKQEKLKELAENDGFDTIEEFLNYFNEDFTGKLIHWTDKKY